MSTTCNFVTAIDGDQCIGDSLATINANFTALDTALCTEIKNSLSSAITLSAKDGITLEIDPRTGTNEPPLYTIKTENSLRYFKATNCDYNNTGIRVIEDNSYIAGLDTVASPKTLNFPSPISETTTNIFPRLTFETTCLGSIPPKLTVYWSASGAPPFVVYNLNPAYNANHLGSGALSFNGTVISLCKRINSVEEYYAGGSFKSYHNTATSAGLGINNPIGIATIDLAQHTLSDPGVLDNTFRGFTGKRINVADPSNPSITSGTNYLNIFNCNPNPTKQTNIGFDLGASGYSVFKIVEASINNNIYVCVGGRFDANFSNGGLTNGTKNLVIFNRSSNTKVEYVVSSTVRDLLIRGDYLYVAGDFNTVKTVNGTKTHTVRSLFRIDLTKLQTPNAAAEGGIDETFIRNLVTNSSVTQADLSIPSIDICEDGKYLYAGLRYGGNTPSIMIVDLRTDPADNAIDNSTNKSLGAGYILKFLSGFGPDPSGLHFVRKIKIETIKDIGGNRLREVMYAGGRFRYYTTGNPKTAHSNSLTFWELQNYEITTSATYQTPRYYDHSPASLTILPSEDGVFDIVTESNSPDSPVYIGGFFRVTPARTSAKASVKTVLNLAAFSKPDGANIPSRVLPWYPNVNSRVRNIQVIEANSPTNDGNVGSHLGISVKSGEKKPSLLICGDFTLPAIRIARISGYNQIPPSSFTSVGAVVWEATAKIIDEGDELNVGSDIVAVSAIPGESGQLNVTELPAFSDGFATAARGKYCRFQLGRRKQSVITENIAGSTVTTTYDDTFLNKPAYVLGVAVDFNEK